jgi:hypothetical protein
LKRAAVAVAVLSLASLAAHAGRPLTTDDAPVVEDRACQIESWVDHNSAMTTGWMAPACNFGWDTEWAFGLARTRDNLADAGYSQSNVQVKKLLVNPSEGGWGYAIEGGLNRFPHKPSLRTSDDPYATAVADWMPNTVDLLHLNIGWMRDRVHKIDSTFWGVAGEHQFNDIWTIVGEVYGDDRTRPMMRLGTTYNVTKTFSFDVSYVIRPGGTSAERFISVGLAWQSVPFLP